ncbi:hypothetical protein [Winogradskya humida]|uniref:Tat pathway signal sequence domain protein n=1 Tax=Winogradskya humida TaxID=113566 RepID=A0ABQ3ZWN4_9ACTN|nr:hypothetical protein [Actinoplanes humidus]GIE23001.1 hypothetical protein Ahu01nite_061030 [Actinoplanes humidus]
MRNLRQWGWGLGIASVTAVAAFGVASWQANASPGTPSSPPLTLPRVSDPSAGPEPAAGAGSDALTSTEVDKARAAAVTPQLASGARDAAGKAGPEYLMADLDEDTGRQAELYYYDYKTDKLIKQVVDLETGKLARSFSAAGMQPPASKQEASVAFDLLLADPLGAEFKAAYRKAAGKELAGKEGLTVTAHIYTARPADKGARQCGAKRCVQLIVETADGRFISVNDLIIDLSGRTVARLT